ncbi:MAG: hypothetical protein RIF33_24045 [Cyclobacteriaceae bacterium]
MTIQELNKKVEQVRAVTGAKMQFLRDRINTLDQAFDEMEAVKDAELDIIHAKIEELNLRLQNLEK